MISILDNSMRFGNILFKCAYDLKQSKKDEKETIYYVNEEHITPIKDILDASFVKLGRTMPNPNPYRNGGYTKFLDPSHCDFVRLEGLLKYDKLSLSDDEITNREYLCVNCRYGDYINSPNNQTYKAFDKCFLSTTLETYKSELSRYQYVVVVSDNIEIAKNGIGSILDEKFPQGEVTYFHEDAVRDFNILINANAIIGSCSTFSFIGYYMNKKNAKMYVEYPYYKFPNASGFSKYQQCELYNGGNIIKVEL